MDAEVRANRRWFWWVALVVMLVLIAYLAHWGPFAPRPAAKQTPPAIPVDVAVVKRADVPVYADGLGTVQAFYTVTVTPRVDGEIEKVAFVEGQEVSKGALLAQIDARPYQAAYDQARGALAKDEATLANARRDLSRYKVLAPEDLASKQTVDTQNSLVAQLEAQVQSDRGNVDAARTQLDYTRITSPIAGRTGIRQVDPGNNVHAASGGAIVVVTQLQPIAVIFTLPEDQFGDLSEALHRGPVEAMALSRDVRKELDRGTVQLIDNQIDQTTGTLRIKAVFPNAERKLWPGEFVNVRALLQTRHQVLVIPASAVQRGPDGVFTYVVQPDMTVAVVPLKIREQSSDLVAVDSGVQEGQRVVTGNQYRLQPKSLVQANQPPTSNAASALAPGGKVRGGKRAVNISKPFIERPVATTLLMAAIFLIGLVAYPMLPVAPLPQVDFPTIQVSAQLPGASPEIMASSVAQPLETQFSQIAGVSQMTSTSLLGTSQITLQFDLGRNIDAAAQDVQSAIDAAGGQLPKNLPAPPSYRKVNPADSPILILSIHSDVLPLTTVDDYAETVVAQQISQQPGVSLVYVGGQQKPAVRVQVDPVRLAAVGLQLEDVASVITSATVDAPQGSINGAHQSFAIYDNDQLLKAAPWNDVILGYKNGAPIRVRDVGVAVDAAENTQLLAWQNSKPGLLLIIFKQPGANVLETVRRIQGILPHMLTTLPPSLRIEKIIDRTTTIKASVEDVQRTLLLTICLVVMVIFLFLRNFWATVIPGVTVPLALLGAAALMYVVGYSLDNLSLMGLTIAVGFVVDDAIVMLENIYRHVEAGLSPHDAAIKGSGEIGFTIMSISISLVAVFIPLLLMSGIIGRLFREFAVTVTMTIAVSAFVALTLSPMMAAQFIRDEKHAKHGRAYLALERMFDWLLRRYTQGLDFVLRHQRATLMVFIVTLAATILMYALVPKGFFPQQDTGVILGVSDAPQDVSFSEMVRLHRRLTDVVAVDPDVESWGAYVGGTRALNTGFAVIGLKPRSERKSTVDQVINRLRGALAKVPGAQLYMQAAQDLNVGGRATRTQYQYTLQDPSLDELNEWAPKLLTELKQLPQLQDTASDQQNSDTKLSLVIDRDQASRFGILPSLIDQTLYDAFGQRQVTQYFTQLNSYHVVLEVTPALQSEPDTLNKLYIKSPVTGNQVPLSTFVRYDTQHTSYLSINHQGQFPAVTMSFNLAPGVALGDAVTAIQKAAAGIHMPAAIQGTFQGTAQAFQDSLKSTPLLILAALVVVYIILGMLYESFIHPLTILSTLPSAGLGALLMLLAFHFDLSVIGIIGIILLIGLVKKNGIMMVDFALQAEREHHLTPEQSIRQACLMRFRPIMMTTMAALLGALPLMLGHGTGSELRQPLGYTMVGGLLLSQALTLFSTPVIYLYLDRMSNRWAAKHAGAPQDGAVSAPPVTVPAGAGGADGV